jgi:preprotein translocase subunit SecE
MKITDYVKETRAEMKHVSWPTRTQAFFYTGIVIIISIVSGVFLGLFDYLASLLVKFFI